MENLPSRSFFAENYFSSQDKIAFSSKLLLLRDKGIKKYKKGQIWEFCFKKYESETNSIFIRSNLFFRKNDRLMTI